MAKAGENTDPRSLKPPSKVLAEYTRGRLPRLRYTDMSVRARVDQRMKTDTCVDETQWWHIRKEGSRDIVK